MRAEKKSIRIIVNFRGRVQGVGFRWQVNEIANHYRCTGYVKNLDNGSVQILAEGEVVEVREFLNHVARTLDRFWHEKEEDERVGNAHFQTFHIQD